MKKWSLRPDPGPHDPARYMLLIKGEMKHVQQIVKKFGSMCGRPTKADHPEGFNFCLPLHGLTDIGRQKVSGFLAELAPGAQTDSAAAVPASAPATAPGAPPATLPVIPAILAPQAPAVPPAPRTSPPATQPPQAGPVLTPPVVAAPVRPETPPPTTSVPPASEPAAGPCCELNAKLSFETLQVGAFNRFAHAAATSVVGSPGAMYNPLFIYGSPGAGKTHLLHAIGTALRKGWDEGSVLLTSGARLANAVSRALAEGRLDALEADAAKAKALLVDDIHLLALTERNRAALAKLFQGFFAKSLQVVLTSVYPARSLGPIEEALKISLAKGWAVDMKLPNTAVQEDMIGVFSERCGAGLAGADIKKLHEKLGAGYGEFPRLVQRWAALAELRRARGGNPNGDELLGELFGPGARSSPTELPGAGELEESRRFAPPAPGSDAVNLALFCPRGQDAMVTWLVARFYETGAALGLTQTYRHVLCEAYDAESPLGVPFQIGESCQRSRAQAALVLGPPRETPLAAREAEFTHAVRHVLDGFGLASGWIPFAETTISRPFLSAHLDFKAFFKR